MAKPPCLFSKCTDYIPHKAAFDFTVASRLIHSIYWKRAFIEALQQEQLSSGNTQKSAAVLRNYVTVYVACVCCYHVMVSLYHVSKKPSFLRRLFTSAYYSSQTRDAGLLERLNHVLLKETFIIWSMIPALYLLRTGAGDYILCLFLNCQMNRRGLNRYITPY